MILSNNKYKLISLAIVLQSFPNFALIAISNIIDDYLIIGNLVTLIGLQITVAVFSSGIFTNAMIIGIMNEKISRFDVLIFSMASAILGSLILYIYYFIFPINLDYSLINFYLISFCAYNTITTYYRTKDKTLKYITIASLISFLKLFAIICFYFDWMALDKLIKIIAAINFLTIVTLLTETSSGKLGNFLLKLKRNFLIGIKSAVSALLIANLTNVEKFFANTLQSEMESGYFITYVTALTITLFLIRTVNAVFSPDFFRLRRKNVPDQKIKSVALRAKNRIFSAVIIMSALFVITEILNLKNVSAVILALCTSTLSFAYGWLQRYHEYFGKQNSFIRAIFIIFIFYFSSIALYNQFYELTLNMIVIFCITNLSIGLTYLGRCIQ